MPTTSQYRTAWSPADVLSWLRGFVFYVDNSYDSSPEDWSNSTTFEVADWEGFYALKHTRTHVGSFTTIVEEFWLILAFIPFSTTVPARVFLAAPGWSSGWLTGTSGVFDDDDLMATRLDDYFGAREATITELTGAILVSFDNYVVDSFGVGVRRETAVEVWEADSEHLVSVDSRVHVPYGVYDYPNGFYAWGNPDQLPAGSAPVVDVSRLLEPLNLIARRDVTFSWGDHGPHISITGRTITEE